MKIQCKNCKDILSDEVHKYQNCSCGKIAFDTSDTTETKLYRILGNEKDYKIIK